MRYWKIIFEGFDSRKIPEDEYSLGERNGVGFSMKKGPLGPGDEEFTLFLPVKQL